MSTGERPRLEADAVDSRRQPDARVERAALRGVPWNVLGYVAGRGLSIVGTIVLARLLAPAEMGVVFTGMLILGAMALLSDSGLGLHLIAREHLSDRMAGTVLSCMVLVGALLAGAAALAAPWLAEVLESPDLERVMPYLALASVFTAVMLFQQNLLARHMKWPQRAAGQLAQSVGYVAVAIPAAALGAGVWSMVAGIVASAVAPAIVMSVLSPRWIRPRFDFAEARTAYRESRSFLAQAATEFVRANGHHAVVAWAFGPSAIGIYWMSNRLAQLPVEVFVTPVSQATFPAYAQLRDSPERQKATFLTSLRYVCAVGLPISAGLITLAPAFALGVLGPRWSGMPPVVAVLGLAGGVGLVASTSVWFINALGGGAFLARLNFVRTAFLIPAAIIAAVVTQSLQAVAFVLLADVIVEGLAVMLYLHHRLGVRARELFSAVRGVVVAVVMLGVAAIAAVSLLESLGFPPLAQFAVGALIAGISYVLTLLLVDRALVGEGFRLVGKAIDRSAKSGA